MGRTQFQNIEYRNSRTLFSGDEQIPANLGMLDQRQALLWVQENIQGSYVNFLSSFLFLDTNYSEK